MFDTLIGQTSLKSKLAFFARAQKATGIVPPILFNAAKGQGKTEFARQFAKNFKRKFIEINAATIGSRDRFFEQVFVHHILDKDVTVLLDECHGLPKDLVDVFLTVFNTDGVKRKIVAVGDSHYEFDFERQTFLFATTEADRLFVPFKDRMEICDFAPYTKSELGEILCKRIDYIKIDDAALAKIIPTLRGNPRSAVKMAEKIKMYCEVNNQSTFSVKNWDSLCNTLGIIPHGLTNNELEILSILKKRGACTLTMLSAATGMSRASLQRDGEIYLLREGLIKIDTKREITPLGHNVYNEIIKAQKEK